MRLWNVWGCLAVAALACPLVIAQSERAGDAPEARATKAEQPEPPKLLVPANKIATLTDEQMRKLTEIATQAERDKEEIMRKAREASFALLTDAQKAEIEAFKQKAREAAAKRKAEGLKRKQERQRIKAEKAKLKATKKTNREATKPEQAGAPDPAAEEPK
jgi:hypothetical protein